MKDNFESALQYSMDRHRGQLDKGWTPYIQHILGVWYGVREEDLTTQIAALLHDVPEDTEGTIEEILQNFGDDVASIVEILTHNKRIPYESYIDSIIQSGNRRAILIKLSDLADNSSPFRLQRLPESSKEYFQRRAKTKYEQARLRLAEALVKLNASR